MNTLWENGGKQQNSETYKSNQSPKCPIQLENGYLNCHWCKDEQICEIESKGGEKKSQLVLLGGRRRLPWMQITKRRR